MRKMYCGSRSKHGRPCYICVGTPEQISLAIHGRVLPIPLRIKNLSIDPQTGAYVEREIPLPHSPKSPEEIGKPRILRKRLDLRNYSDEFEWGQEDAGCLQLSIAILADFLGDSRVQDAIEKHEQFARIVIRALPRDHWTLSDRELGFFVNIEIVE